MVRLATALTAAFALVASTQAIQKVSRAGRYLYNADGSRFYIKGIAYQEQGTVIADPNNPFGEPSTFIDPLANGTACSRDLPYLKQLTVNALRAYSVDSTLNHDACMSLFSNAGIYVIIDLSLPVNGSIDRLSPAWTTNLLDSYIETINAFSKYDNVLGYNVGNEVITVTDYPGAAAFVKAAARDTKAYLASISSSALVGYAAIDGASNTRDPLANYFSCDPSGSNSGASAIDMYGLNIYSWCGASSFSASYAGVEGDFAGFNIPAYFSEFGSILCPPRLWTEVGALFSSQMSDVWSGGVAFSYFPATSAQGQFGMVTISSDGSTVTTSDDFTKLVAQYSAASPPTTPSKTDAGSTNYPACPTQNSTFLTSLTLPPTPNDSACACVASSLSCHFTPQTSNITVIVGELLDGGCGLLGGVGLNCNDIAGNGTTGTYGRLSECDPSTKLAYVMSLYYESQNKNAQACSFAGNGTVNASPAGSAAAVASSCIANPSATFTPTSPSSGSGSSGSGKPSASGSSHSSGALTVAFGDPKGWMGLGMMLVMSTGGAIWTLA